MVGAGLRLYRLDFQSLWNDELSSWRRSSYETLGQVVTNAVDDVHPPGHHIVLWAVGRWLGESEYDLRLPSVLFGTLTIIYVFLIGRRLYSDREGLIAAGLTAVLWCPIYYSQEARMYALLVLATVGATYHWLGLVADARAERDGRWPGWVAYGAVAVVACYSHYYGLLVVGLQAVALGAITWRRRRRRVATTLTYSLIGLAYLPWAGPALADLIGEKTGREPPGLEALLSFATFLFNRSPLLAGLAAACLVALLAQTLVRQRPGGRPGGWRDLLASPGALLAAWLLLPVLVTFAMSWIREPMFVNRYLIISMPAAYLLLARSFTRLSPAPWLASTAGVAFSLLAVYHLIGPLAYYSKPRKGQFREAVAHIADRDAELSDSLLVGYAWSSRYFDYYFERLGSERRIELKAGRLEDLERVLEKVARREPRYLWFIAAHRVPEAEFVEALAERFELLEHRRFRKAETRLFAVGGSGASDAARETSPVTPFDPVPRSHLDRTPEIGGRVVLEAELFTGQQSGSGRYGRALWRVVDDAWAGGSRFVDAQPNVGVSTGDRLAGARLDYLIDFSETGTYRVWVRMLGRGSRDNSIHVGLDGTAVTLGGRGLSHRGDNWAWRSRISGVEGEEGRVVLEVPGPGLHYLNVWMREDGVALDQILLTRDLELEPEGILATVPPVEASPEGTPASPPELN